MNQQSQKRVFIKPEITAEELSKALYEANQKILAVNQQLKESEQIRLEMLSNLSHDFRSPISTLKSSLEYLLSFDQLTVEDIKSTLTVMDSKVTLLDRFMDQLLLMTTLASTDCQTLNFEPIQLGLFLEDFFYSNIADPKYNERNLIIRIPSDFPYFVSIDPKMIYRALDNLLTNALKYSSSNDTITLDAFKKDDYIVTTISDTGCGINTSHIARIFDRTYTVSTARTPHHTTGCGLGLYIVQSIITKHGGQVWCESQEGIGSTFSFTLPILNEPLH